MKPSAEQEASAALRYSVLAEHMMMLELIPELLTPDLLSAEWDLKRRTEDPAVKGHCYVASEVAQYLVGKYYGFSPYVSKLEGGGTHWFLRNDKGQIIDLTSEQFPEAALDGIWEAGRKCGFLTKNPSRRGSILINRVMTRTMYESSILLE